MDSTEWLNLAVDQVLTDPALGAQGPTFPGGFVAPSAAALSSAVSNALSLHVDVPDSGIGTYVAACMGVKPSGGFSVDIQSARLRRDEVTIGLMLHELGRNEFAFQALSSPFAVALIRDLDPKGKTFSFLAELDWEIVQVRE